MSRVIYSVALAMSVQAAIVENGLWTGNDWYDDVNKVGVANGVPYSNDSVRQRQLASPQSYDGRVDNYMDMDNVQRVARVFSSADWDRGFPQANSVYTYQGFLKAVAKFPYFCGETNISGWTLDNTCRRELATIFAHWGQETGKRSPDDGEFWTQGLYWVREIARGDYKDYGWSNNAWPNQDGVQYYGRGPMQLSWNYNYGQFSNIYASPSSYNSKMELLIDPDRVAREGDVAMAAGLWFYMTPQDPKPSMHDVMTGNFVPNATDIAANVTNGFGTTTNIINGGLECGSMNPDKQASRAEYYTKWLDFFGLPNETNLTCSNQPAGMPLGGAGDVAMYFEQAWSGETRCQVVGYMTQYSLVARDDYKRCVCDKFGSGEADCPTSDAPAPAPSPSPEPSPEPTPDPKWQTFATLEEIRNNPHYSDSSNSRTMYQVDREVQFIGDKLEELYQALINNGMLNN